MYIFSTQQNILGHFIYIHFQISCFAFKSLIVILKRSIKFCFFLVGYVHLHEMNAHTMCKLAKKGIYSLFQCAEDFRRFYLKCIQLSSDWKLRKISCVLCVRRPAPLFGVLLHHLCWCVSYWCFVYVLYYRWNIDKIYGHWRWFSSWFIDLFYTVVHFSQYFVDVFTIDAENDIWDRSLSLYLSVRLYSEFNR